MKNSKGLVLLLIVFIITTIALGGFIVYDKFLKEEPKNVENEKKNIESNENKKDFVQKLNQDKDWVYDAEYEKNVNVNSYTTDYNETYYAKDIRVPFLNIDSDYATTSNQEIKNIFDSAIKKYNEGTNDLITYITCNYEKIIKDNIASVLLTSTTGATDIAQSKYYTYMIDLKNGEKLSYESTYKLAGLNSDTINSKIEMAITKAMKEKMSSFALDSEVTDFDTYNNRSIENYKKSVNNNTIKYFLDNDNKLNIIVTLNIPIGAEDFDTIISIE